MNSASFLDTVLALEPKIATFDCDGTLWSGDAGEGFFSWELAQGVVSDEIVRWARPRYADYRAGNVPEEVMCGEMVTMHRGLRESDVLAAARRYFDNHFADHIFPEMQELIARLQAQGCDVWAVSSTNEWVIRVAMRHFAIQEMIQRAPIAAFGNSIWDADMLRLAQHAFAVNPNPNLKSIADEAGWTV